MTEELSKRELLEALADYEKREKDTLKKFEEMDAKLTSLKEELEAKEEEPKEEPKEEPEEAPKEEPEEKPVEEAVSKGIVESEVRESKEMIVNDKVGFTISEEAYTEFNESLRPDSWLHNVKWRGKGN